MPTASCQKIPVGRIRASPHRHRRSVQRMRRTEPIGRPATASRVIRPGRFRRVRAGVARSRGRPFSNPRTRGCATERGNWARGFTVTARGGAITGRLLRRPGQVAVVSPITSFRREDGPKRAFPGRSGRREHRRRLPPDTSSSPAGSVGQPLTGGLRVPGRHASVGGVGSIGVAAMAQKGESPQEKCPNWVECSFAELATRLATSPLDRSSTDRTEANRFGPGRRPGPSRPRPRCLSPGPGAPVPLSNPGERLGDPT